MHLRSTSPPELVRLRGCTQDSSPEEQTRIHTPDPMPTERTCACCGGSEVKAPVGCPPVSAQALSDRRAEKRLLLGLCQHLDGLDAHEVDQLAREHRREYTRVFAYTPMPAIALPVTRQDLFETAICSNVLELQLWPLSSAHLLRQVPAQCIQVGCGHLRSDLASRIRLECICG